MKKVVFIILLILVLFLLASYSSNISIVDTMSDSFKTIEKNGDTTLCYDINTNAVYIVYHSPYLYGISPYVVFDDLGRATVGKWDGEKIIAETIDNK